MRAIADQVLRPALELLPPELWTPGAWQMIAAIGDHASGYRSRRPMVRTSERGFWRLAPVHVEEVLRYTKGRPVLLEAAQELGYGLVSLDRQELKAALEHNDILGAIVARCMIPPALEPRDAAEGWQVYRSIWWPQGAADEAAPASWGLCWERAGTRILEPLGLAVVGTQAAPV